MRHFLTILLIVLFGTANAAKVKFTAQSSHKNVEVGQRFQVSFTINAAGGNFTPPNFSSFRVLSGPNQSNRVQIINGRSSRETTLSYILVATKKGEFTIPPAKVVVNGKTYTTNPLEINVTKNAQNNNGNIQNNKQVFLRVMVDKKTAYVGEKISVTYKLYSKVGINGLDLEKAPDLNGFWAHNINTIYDEIKFKRERLNGEIYHTSKLQQSVLYPQRAGELTIDPMKLKLAINVRSRHAQSIFDQMFGGYERKEISVGTSPIKIDVKALPEKNKPADFSGAVGNFQMELKSNKDSVRANEAIDLKVTIKGKGNLPFIGSPEINFPPDFEVYDPEIENKYKTNYNGAQGAKVYNYLVIPRHEGNFSIPPYAFSYFDLNEKRYKTIYSDTLNIHVAKGETVEGAVYQSSQKEDIELLNKDIRYIHLNDIKLYATKNQFYGSTLFYSLLGLFVLFTTAVWYFAKRKKSLQSDLVGLRKAKANKMAKKRLSKANKLLKANDLTTFYEEVSAALYGYFSDKYNIEIANLSLEKIVSLIEESGGEEQLKKNLTAVLEEAEMARFAKSSNIDARNLYQQAVAIISQTENITKA